MKTISCKEITQLYRACGLNSSIQYEMRTDINTGTLSNRLNTNYEFLNRTSAVLNPSNSSVLQKKENMENVTE